MRATLNSSKMAYAAFESMAAAEQHRGHYGGWIFAAADGSEFIWFDPSFTATPIMNHKATRGMSGSLR